jgi:hypothetical protein
MRRRHRYRIGGWDRLEARRALTHGGPITPALFGTLSPTPQASGPAGRVVAQSNAAFDSFAQDYAQAQGAYLSAGSSGSSAAFKAFTTQRVNLLAQELTRIFYRLPGSFARIQDTHQRSQSGNSAVVFQAFLYNRINGGANTSLLSILTSDSVLPPAGTNGSSATLFTLTANNAIQSARIATINGAKYIANNTFKNSKH